MSLIKNTKEKCMTLLKSRIYLYFNCYYKSDSPRQSPRPQKQSRQPIKQEKDGTPKHEIVVVADGNVPIKDPDPELTKLNTIPLFYPIIRGSLNIPTGSRDTDLLDRLDPKAVS